MRSFKFGDGAICNITGEVDVGRPRYGSGLGAIGYGEFDSLFYAPSDDIKRRSYYDWRYPDFNSYVLTINGVHRVKLHLSKQGQ